NLGVQHARGEVIAFLDADDIWHPRKLELQLQVMLRNPRLGLLGTGTFAWPAPSLPGVTRLMPDSVVPVLWRQLVVKNYLATSSVLARREVLEKGGLFDADLQGPEDHDLWLRVAEFA